MSTVHPRLPEPNSTNRRQWMLFRHRVGRGALVGALAGACIGLAIFVAEQWLLPSRPAVEGEWWKVAAQGLSETSQLIGWVLQWGVLGLLAGTAAGIIVGWFVRRVPAP